MFDAFIAAETRAAAREKEAWHHSNNKTVLAASLEASINSAVTFTWMTRAELNAFLLDAVDHAHQQADEAYPLTDVLEGNARIGSVAA